MNIHRKITSDSDSEGDTSDEERRPPKRERPPTEPDAGNVVCVELTDKKKAKESWFPALVVAPTAQDTVKIDSKKDYLVRSFQDGR